VAIEHRPRHDLPTVYRADDEELALGADRRHLLSLHYLGTKALGLTL